MHVGVYLNYPPTFFNHGGGETIYFKMLENLNELNDVTAERLLPPTEQKFDIVHVIGSTLQNVGVCEAAKGIGAKTVVSSIWMSMRGSLTLRARKSLLSLIPMDQEYKLRKSVFENADVIVANSEIEKKQLGWNYGVPAEKIEVVYLAADTKFIHSEELSFSDLYGVKEYILCVGRVCKRKNQCAVLDCAHDLGIDVVFIGGVDPNEQEYGESLRQMIASESKIKAIWLGSVPHESNLLASAYQCAKVHVLASKGEYPGLSSVEAAMYGTSVVVAEAPTVREYFGDYAYYCSESSLDSIKLAINGAIRNSSSEKSSQLRDFVRSRYSWDAYVLRMVDVYRSLLSE